MLAVIVAVLGILLALTVVVAVALVAGLRFRLRALQVRNSSLEDSSTNSS